METVINAPNNISGRRAKISRKMIDDVANAAKVVNNRFHVFPRQGKWVVKKNGASRALSIFSTQDAALQFVTKEQQLNKGIYIVLHDSHGRIVKMTN